MAQAVSGRQRRRHGQLVWPRVNENGLERIYLPSGSRIQTASETRYTSGDTYNTTVYVDHVEDLDTILRIAKNARITTRMGAK